MADRKRSLEVYGSWAEEAWCGEYGSDPEQPASKSYAAGFKDGFADFVFAGGSGEPPPVPPRQFWNTEVRNPRGRSEATDWFAGFRHGAQVAREEGHRDRALVPSSLFLFGPQAGCWGDEPSCVDSSAEVTAGPLQLENGPSGRPTPESGAEVIQPEFPEPELLEPELPEPAAPEVEMPSIAIPETEDVPTAEELPQLESEPEEEVNPPQPTPIEAPAEENRPTTDVDDIFGALGRRRSTTERQVQYLANRKKVIPRDASADQARMAFASAIRRHSATVKSTNEAPKLNIQTQSDQRIVTNARTAVTSPTSRAKASHTPRAATIPVYQDNAEEMFHRLAR